MTQSSDPDLRNAELPPQKRRVAVAPGAHPTRLKLLASALALLEEKLPEDISSEMILAHSGVSKGSLYHHFEDLSDLLETALAQTFSRTVDQNILELVEVIRQARDEQELFDRLVIATRMTQSPALRPNRFRRARLLVYSETNPRFAGKLAHEQARLTDAFTDLFRMAQDKGWMAADFDPRAGAVLVQAYTLGKMIDDISTNPMDPEEWDRIIVKIIRDIFMRNVLK